MSNKKYSTEEERKAAINRRRKRQQHQTARQKATGVPVPTDTCTSLTQQLATSGRIKVLPETTMLRAKHLYVTKGLPVKVIARDLDIEPTVIERWAHLFNWHDMRTERERQQYQRVLGIRRSFTPNIDQKHDRLYNSIEGLLEDTLQHMQNSDQPVTPAQLRTLSSVLKNCQDGRRIIQGKEQNITKNVKEVSENTDLLDNVIEAIGKLSGKSTPSSGLTIMDADYEEMDEEAPNQA